MRFPVLFLLMTGIVFSLRGQKESKEKSFYLLVGTYTSSAKSEGIYVFDFNTETGKCELKSGLAGEENPSYLTVSKDGRHVYSTNEVRKGNISSFEFDKTTGELKFMNRVGSGGESPCFVEFDDEDKFLFTGNCHTSPKLFKRLLLFVS